MENEIDEEVIVNTQEETVDLDTTEVDESSNEEEFDWKAEATKQKQIAENQRIRAEKAERKGKVVTSQTAQKADSPSSTKDLYALMEAKVPLDDVSEVEDYAKYKGISITEALKTQAVRSILNEKAEARNVSQATNTGVSKRSSSRPSDDMLLSNARKGIMPDSDEDLARLARLKRG